MRKNYGDISYEIRENIAHIIINKLEKYNAFRTNTTKELYLALEKAELDENGRVIVLRGAGGYKAFCSGGDMC